MDWIGTKEKLRDFLKRYWYVVLVLAVGLILMAIPTGNQEAEVSEQLIIPDNPALQEQLEEILMQIRGAGKVKVLLTESCGAQTVYQTDQDTRGEGSGNVKTVIVTDSDRNQTGRIYRIDPPVYLGAVIVCQGGDSAAVKLAIVEAVSSVTGLSSDRITVLKMK